MKDPRLNQLAKILKILKQAEENQKHTRIFTLQEVEQITEEARNLIKYINKDLKETEAIENIHKSKHEWEFAGTLETNTGLYPVLRCKKCGLEILAELTDDERYCPQECEGK